MTDWVPEADVARAAEHDICSVVRQRQSPGTPWRDVGVFDDLRRAVAAARETDAPETSVSLLTGRGHASLRYWNSELPGLFNSSVIDTIIFLRRTDGFSRAPDDDDFQAELAGDRFSISVRRSPEADWETVASDLERLHTAMREAQEQDAAACRVVVQRAGGEDPVYWTSEEANEFRTEVLGTPSRER